MTAESPSPGSPPGRLLVLPFYDGPRVVVVLAGEADVSNAARLRDRLLGCVTHGPRSLDVDASDLTFCDLQGLDALTDALDVAERSGVAVSVRPSANLTWLMATVERASQTSGRLGLEPPGRPLPSSTRQTA